MKQAVGVLGFQGDRASHQEMLDRLGIPTPLIRTKESLTPLTHLIIPGGESPVIGRFLKESGLGPEIQNRVGDGTLKIFGTCAGAILLGHGSEWSLNLIDADIDRNAYGAQIHSFQTNLSTTLAKTSLPAVFIRAPKITRVGADIEILASHNSDIVLCKNQNVMISTFHPELTEDSTIHSFFLQT